jgi:type VI secretion system protein VasI
MFHPSPVTFIREMMGGESLFVETSPINEGPFEMTFKIAGLSNAIKPLQKACHWQ